MNNSTTKQLVMVSKTGPAFSLSEITAAHAALDAAGAPRLMTNTDIQLTLAQRIHWLHGQLVSARQVKAQTVVFACKRGRR